MAFSLSPLLHEAMTAPARQATPLYLCLLTMVNPPRRGCLPWMATPAMVLTPTAYGCRRLQKDALRTLVRAFECPRRGVLPSASLMAGCVSAAGVQGSVPELAHAGRAATHRPATLSSSRPAFSESSAAGLVFVDPENQQPARAQRGHDAPRDALPDRKHSRKAGVSKAKKASGGGKCSAVLEYDAKMLKGEGGSELSFEELRALSRRYRHDPIARPAEPAATVERPQPAVDQPDSPLQRKLDFDAATTGRPAQRQRASPADVAPLDMYAGLFCDASQVSEGVPDSSMPADAAGAAGAGKDVDVTAPVGVEVTRRLTFSSHNSSFAPHADTPFKDGAEHSERVTPAVGGNSMARMFESMAVAAPADDDAADCDDDVTLVTRNALLELDGLFKSPGWKPAPKQRSVQPPPPPPAAGGGSFSVFVDE